MTPHKKALVAELPDIVFTLHESKTGSITKSFELSENGGISKIHAARLCSGTSHTVSCKWPEFQNILSNAKPQNALSFGINKHVPIETPYKITTNKKENIAEGLYARVKKNFVYSRKGGIMLFDYDPNANGQAFENPAAFMSLLSKVHPELAAAAHIIKGSVSSGVHVIGEQPAENAGFHVYIPVADSADIPRYGNLLFNRLILAGNGYIDLAKNGSILLRTPLDKSVFNPWGLDFIAQPIIGAGLANTPPEIITQQGVYLDTTSLLDLTDNDRSALNAKNDTLKSDARPASQRLHSVYIENYKRTHLDASADDIALLSGGTLPRNYIVETEDGTQVTIQQLIDRGADVVIADPVEGSSYGKTTAIFYANPDGGKPCIHSFAHGDKVYDIAEINQKPPSDDALQIKSDIEFLLHQHEEVDVDECRVDADVIQKIIERIFWNPQVSKFFTLTKHNILNMYTVYDVMIALSSEHGDIINKQYLYSLAHKDNDKERKKISGWIKGCESKLLYYLKINSQRTSIEMRVDMFATEPRIEMREELARIIYINKPLTTPLIQNDAVVEDYKLHFPFFDAFFDFVLACRFARDRKKSYLWFKCSTDWGKGFLMGLLRALDLSIELSPKEIESCIEGKPVGLSMAVFKNPKVLVFDEWKSVKSELKQLQSHIKLSPKNQLSFTAEIFAKVFFSAEEVGSLVSEHGVEQQFLNRFNHFKFTGEINKRELWKKVGAGAYMDGLIPYGVDYMNAGVERYVALGEKQAEREAELYLDDFMVKHGLHNFHQSLDEGLPKLVREIAEYINKEAIFNHAQIFKHNGDLYLKNAGKYIQEYIKDKEPDSVHVMIKMKSKQIIEMLSFEGEGARPHRIPGRSPELTRCVLINPELYSEILGHVLESDD